jgi:hypothetical protein
MYIPCFFSVNFLKLRCYYILFYFRDHYLHITYF